MDNNIDVKDEDFVRAFSNFGVFRNWAEALKKLSSDDLSSFVRLLSLHNQSKLLLAIKKTGKNLSKAKSIDESDYEPMCSVSVKGSEDFLLSNSRIVKSTTSHGYEVSSLSSSPQAAGNMTHRDLKQAIRDQNLDSIKKLLNEMKKNYTLEDSEYEIISEAVSTGNIEILVILKAYGINFKRNGQLGRTSLADD